MIKYKHYVYAHLRKDTGEVFYIGKGTDSKKYVKLHRAKETSRRNPVWKAVVAKHGYSVKILAVRESDCWAKTIEIALIKHYGRRDLKTGSLVNFTDGGDGSCGTIASAELRKKRSENSKGKRSEAWTKAIRIARKNGGNGGVVKMGDKLPDWWKARIAKAKIGFMNPMYGKPSQKRKAVVNIETGEAFSSITAAAKSLGIRVQILHQRMTRDKYKFTPMRFKDAA